MNILQAVKKIPGGLMVVPLLLGAIVNTFFGNVLWSAFDGTFTSRKREGHRIITVILAHELGWVTLPPQAGMLGHVLDQQIPMHPLSAAWKP